SSRRRSGRSARVSGLRQAQADTAVGGANTASSARIGGRASVPEGYDGHKLLLSQETLVAVALDTGQAVVGSLVFALAATRLGMVDLPCLRPYTWLAAPALRLRHCSVVELTATVITATLLSCVKLAKARALVPGQ